MSSAQPGTFKALIEAKELREKEERAKLELVPKDVEIQQSSNEPTYPPTHLPTYSPDDTKKLANQPVSPERDFSKVPNSIKRAVEKGKFPNSSLAIYLYLYSLTRGALQPKRNIRVNKAKLLSGANLRAEKALLKNLAHLKSIGFVKITVFNGDHSGNDYEVFMPEEIESNPPTYLPTEQPTYLPTKHTQVPTDQRLVGRWVETIEDKDTYSHSKTSFKDNTKNDDDNARVVEAFSVLTSRLDEAAKKLTGKGVSKTESEKWGTLADLLILELEIAASRASGVSSVPAFLTEVLRRQFFASRQQKPVSAKSSKTKPDKVGEPEQSSYEIKALDEAGRAGALAQIQEFANDDFLEDFKKWYTPEDWSWLIAELKKDK